jgi:hypothetical protein
MQPVERIVHHRDTRTRARDRPSPAMGNTTETTSWTLIGDDRQAERTVTCVIVPADVQELRLGRGPWSRRSSGLISPWPCRIPDPPGNSGRSSAARLLRRTGSTSRPRR